MPMQVAAENAARPETPEGLIELRWSADFAALIASECAQFEMALVDMPHQRLTAFMDSLLKSGVDLLNHDTVYADGPVFDGESVKWLFARGDLHDVVLSSDIAFCDIAEFVYTSDMLTGAMLRRIEPAGKS